MRIYHGTSADNLESIQRHGLWPRGEDEDGNWAHSVRSRLGYVHLTNAHPWYFAGAAVKEWAAEERALVLEVEVDESHLYPDEDFLAQALHLQGHHKDMGLNELTEAVNLRGNQELWRESLEAMGSVAHEGTIPWECVTRYAIVWDWRFMLCCADMSVGIIAHSVLKDKSEALTRMGMGDLDEWLDPTIEAAVEERVLPADALRPLRIDPDKRTVVDMRDIIDARGRAS